MNKSWMVVLGILVLGVFCVRAQDAPDIASHAMVIARESTVIYRGEAVLAGSKAVITLPDFFERVTKASDRSVQLTCKGGWSPLYATEVVGGKFTVSTTAAGNPAQTFWWEVKAGYVEGR